MSILVQSFSDFISSITASSNSVEDFCYSVFCARGFLLDRQNKKIIMSDNQHDRDRFYLSDLLSKFAIGHIHNNEVIFEQKPSIDALSELFCTDYSYGIGALDQWHDASRFRHNYYVPKVEVKILEPFIARFVKALSACSVETGNSCDGNHTSKTRNQRMMISVADPYYHAWYKFIMTHYLRDFCPTIYWNNDFQTMRINNKNRFQCYYEINRFAEYLYFYRIEIRQIRYDAINALSLQQIKHLEEDAIIESFLNNAEKLFQHYYNCANTK